MLECHKTEYCKVELSLPLPYEVQIHRLSPSIVGGALPRRQQPYHSYLVLPCCRRKPGSLGPVSTGRPAWPLSLAVMLMAVLSPARLLCCRVVPALSGVPGPRARFCYERCRRPGAASLFLNVWPAPPSGQPSIAVVTVAEGHSETPGYFRVLHGSLRLYVMEHNKSDITAYFRTRCTKKASKIPLTARDATGQDRAKLLTTYILGLQRRMIYLKGAGRTKSRCLVAL